MAHTTFPEVEVALWTAERFWVVCPFCEEHHCHGRDVKFDETSHGRRQPQLLVQRGDRQPYVYRSGTRVSHCQPPRTYAYRYPFDEENGKAWWEIDQLRGRFVNVKLRQSYDAFVRNEDRDCKIHQRDQNTQRFTRDIADSSLKFADAEETFTIRLPDTETFEMNILEYIIAEVVEGNVYFVERYLPRLSESTHRYLIHGRDERKNSALILASMEESIEMVALLIENGSDVNAVNEQGRSALMEASLWGRAETVKLLLQHRADPNLRDLEDRRAIDFAETSLGNQEERSSRGLIYKEDTYAREIDRSEIRGLLNQDVTPKPLLPAQESHQDYRFRRDPANFKIDVVGPIDSLKISSKYKAVAYLHRPDPFPEVCAKSGWCHEDESSSSGTPVISGRIWTSHVLQVAKCIGYKLENDVIKDQGICGQFDASHAEKQLVAYFIFKHGFLELYGSESNKPADLENEEQDSEQDSKRLYNWSNGNNIPNLGDDERTVKRETGFYGSLMEISKPESKPPVSLRSADISVSSCNRQICVSCKSFAGAVKSHFGWALRIYEKSE